MTTVTGTIAAVQEVRTHNEPATNNGGDWTAGASPTVTVGAFTNTGNVPQIFGSVVITNPIHCTILDHTLLHNGEPAPSPITLQPNEDVEVQVQLKLDSPAPGTPAEPFSFDCIGTWS